MLDNANTVSTQPITWWQLNSLMHVDRAKTEKQNSEERGLKRLCDIVVGAAWAGLSISETVDLQGLPPKLPRGFTENGPKNIQ